MLPPRKLCHQSCSTPDKVQSFPDVIMRLRRCTVSLAAKPAALDRDGVAGVGVEGTHLERDEVG